MLPYPPEGDVTKDERNRSTDERGDPTPSLPLGDNSEETGIPEFGPTASAERSHPADQDVPVNPDAPEELKARQARGNLGPERQKGFGQGA